MLDLLVTLTSVDEMALYPHATGFILGNEAITVRMNHGFSFVQMKEIIECAKHLHKKVYLNFNRIFLENERVQLETAWNDFATLDVDGILFSDFAIYMLAKKQGLLAKLVYASETQIVNYYDIEVLHQQGVPSFIVSKEMTLKGIMTTLQHTQAKIGMQVFGHYSMFYSRRHLITDFRNHYHLPIAESTKHPLFLKEENRPFFFPVIQDENGTHVFSHDVLCAIEECLALASQGVAYFIFDSIFLGPQVTSQVVSLFYDSLTTGKKMDLETASKRINLTNLSTGFFYKDTGVNNQ